MCFEVIEVDQQQRERLLMTTRLGEGACRCLVPAAAVEHRGQVDDQLRAQLLVSLLAPGDEQ